MSQSEPLKIICYIYEEYQTYQLRYKVAHLMSFPSGKMNQYFEVVLVVIDFKILQARITDD